jgi:hypothetical protein
MKRLPTLTCGLALLGVALFLTSCAAKPESIPPAYVSHMVYLPYTVEQLGQEESRLQAALATSSDAQRKARSNDTVGVIFLGLPVSSLSGSNQAANIARIKGELEAVQKAIILKSSGQAPQMGAEAVTAPAPAAK